jgi:hypothetical protein
MKKKYIVELPEEERDRLTEMISKGRTSAYKIKRANILLKADVQESAWNDAQISEAFSVHPNTVGNIRKRYVQQGLEAVINRQKQTRLSRERTFDGESEARLIALSCSDPPEGYGRWTLRLLADKIVEMEIVDTVSYETIRKTLKKTS